MCRRGAILASLLHLVAVAAFAAAGKGLQGRAKHIRKVSLLFACHLDVG
jgi:hypothetical protein